MNLDEYSEFARDERFLYRRRANPITGKLELSQCPIGVLPRVWEPIDRENVVVVFEVRP